MTHVVLRQHKLKLVVQHYSLCVNMGITNVSATLLRLLLI